MRDRTIIAVYVLGALAVVGGGGIYLYGLFADISVERREQPDATPPAARTNAPPATHTPMSSARGGTPAAAARPAFVSAVPACTPSLLGSVLGLLGSLLGGGGRC